MKVSPSFPRFRPPRRPAALARAFVAVALVAALAVPVAVAQQDAIAPSAWRQITALMAEKASRTPAQRNISSRLLHEIKRQRDDPSLAGLPELRTGVAVREDGRVLVDITSPVDEALLARIERLGGRVVNHHASYDAVRAELPLDRVEELAEWKGLRSIRPAEAFMTQAVVTEGDVAHEADQLRTDTGADGSGVTACAISDSVEQLANLIASGELPAGTTVLAGQSGAGSSEGTALLEIIHDMAPGADLVFATANGGQAQFATNIQDLRAAGFDVIVDDAIYVAEGVFQDGIVAQAVETVVEDGAIYVSAAGNSGSLSNGTSGVWEGPYNGTTLPASIPAPPGTTAHDFTGAGPAGNANGLFEDPANDAQFFTLQWADSLGGSGNDYDLYLLNASKTSIEASSTDVQNGNDVPFEGISSAGINDTGRQLVVVKNSGATDVWIHLNTHRARLQTGTDGQIFGHPGAAGAIAVAAVNVSTAGGAGGVFDGTESVEDFSSDGPRRIFFEADGSPALTAAPAGDQLPGARGIASPPVVRQKPDIAAADGVSTTTPGFTTFFGTSAAAPHVAGLAALWIEAVEGLMTDALAGAGLPLVTRAAQMRGLVYGLALDIEALGFDDVSGAGVGKAGPLATEQAIFADGFESGDTAAWSQ